MRLVIKDATKILCMDLELTCWPCGMPPSGECAEIIQFGWCFLDPVTGERSGRDQILIRPQRSKVSEYCTGLTGITWEELRRHGVPYDAACKRLIKMGMRKYACFCLGDDVSEILRQCVADGAEVPVSQSWVDAGILLRVATKADKRLSLEAYCDLAGVAMEGRSHRADWDAWNLAGVLGKYMTLGASALRPQGLA